MSLKINGGQFKGISLESPSGNKTRPTSNMLREAVFNICQNKLENARFLDIFSGTGAMGLEALSRGASFSVFIEKDRNAIQSIKSNIKKLKCENQTLLLPYDCMQGLKKISDDSFDIIYIDPPYGEKKQEESSLALVKKILDHLDHALVADHGWIFIEFSSYCKEDFSKWSFETLKWDNKRTFARSDLHLFKKKEASI